MRGHARCDREYTDRRSAVIISGSAESAPGRRR